ncbi:Phosphodiesterase yfcE [Raoultella planticola]|uniref:Phosphoesterase n=1 Tax=Raoultella planticola TaxID=575 RepID=A0A485C5P0_RAOPL|nr:Phosphodiesterase yfcE [Raoultella planticola]
MKLMFASDIHGSLPATERVLERFAQSGAQWLIILGDVLNHGPRNALPEGYAPADVAVKLNGVAQRVIAVRGNCDSEVDQMLLDFPVTAPWQQVLSERTRLFLTHGHLYSPENMPPLAAGDGPGLWSYSYSGSREERHYFSLQSRLGQYSQRGIFRQLWPHGRGTDYQVLALDDHQVIAEVAINP